MEQIICKCGNEFEVTEKRLSAGRGKYCSNVCKYKYRKRPRNLKYVMHKKNPTSFKKGAIPWNIDKHTPYLDKSTGYMHVKINGKNVKLHRKIVSEQIGEVLDETKIIHHIDENKLNNSPDNLMVMTRSSHMKLHWRLRRG